MATFTRAQYCKAVLQAIGNGSPTTGTINWMVNWSAQEDNSVVNGKYNLFNTTLPMPGSHGGGSQGNIQYYTSFTQGVQATAMTLKNGLYPELLKDLQTNNTNALAAGSGQLVKDMATWGTGWNAWYANPPATSLLQQVYQGNTGTAGTVASGKQWFQWPFANDYAGPEPFFNGPKPDLNVQCPDGTPITVLFPGIISGINSPSGTVPSWGASLTIRLDTPINAIATHLAYLHLQPIPANLKVGQRVAPGDVIGYSGGATAQGAEKVPLGLALFNGDVYGYGPTWSQYLGDQRLNPYKMLSGIAKSGIPGVSGSSGNSLVSTLSANLTSISVAPNASVTQLLVAIDQVGALKNPFDTSNNNVPTDTILGATFDDPMQWLAAVGSNTFEDTKALAFRAVLFIIGAALFYKILTQFIDVGKVVDAGKNLGLLAAGL
jgi:hypothetical protein